MIRRFHKRSLMPFLLRCVRIEFLLERVNIYLYGRCLSLFSVSELISNINLVRYGVCYLKTPEPQDLQKIQLHIRTHHDQMSNISYQYLEKCLKKETMVQKQ